MTTQMIMIMESTTEIANGKESIWKWTNDKTERVNDQTASNGRRISKYK